MVKDLNSKPGSLHATLPRVACSSSDSVSTYIPPHTPGNLSATSSDRGGKGMGELGGFVGMLGRSWRLPPEELALR